MQFSLRFRVRGPGRAAGREETQQQGNRQASFAQPAAHDGRMPVFAQTCNGKLLDERAHDGE